jgi:hypothetical protein
MAFYQKALNLFYNFHFSDDQQSDGDLLHLQYLLTGDVGPHLGVVLPGVNLIKVSP